MHETGTDTIENRRCSTTVLYQYIRPATSLHKETKATQHGVEERHISRPTQSSASRKTKNADSSSKLKWKHVPHFRKSQSPFQPTRRGTNLSHVFVEVKSQRRLRTVISQPLSFLQPVTPLTLKMEETAWRTRRLCKCSPFHVAYGTIRRARRLEVLRRRRASNASEEDGARCTSGETRTAHRARHKHKFSAKVSTLTVEDILALPKCTKKRNTELFTISPVFPRICCIFCTLTR